MDKQMDNSYTPLKQEPGPESHDEGISAAHRSASFWCEASRSIRRGASLDDQNQTMDFLMRCDTSQRRVNAMFDDWADPERKLLSLEALRDGLAQRHRMTFTLELLHAAMRDIEKSNPKMKLTVDGFIDLEVFSCFWQRLMLGVLYREMHESLLEVFAHLDVRLITYSTSGVDEMMLSEYDCHFGQERLGIADHSSQWVRVDHASRDCVIRFGLRAQLHPLATEDAINASMDGVTKVRRHRNQYFVCLEIYKVRDQDEGKSRVTPRVTRSVIFIVTTGKPLDFRNQTITLVNAEIKGKFADPLDRFTTDNGAAICVLDQVHRILKRDHELRQHNADFLLFIILHCATDEMLPIIREYSFRLTGLKASMDKHSVFPSNWKLDEVSDMSVELKELGQWIAQMQGILAHLLEDAERDINKNEDKIELFGASEKNEDLRLHLSDTRDNLQQLSDRLHVLESMALSVREDHARYRENRMQKTLYNLTVCTFVCMPFQCLAGIYGMNFVDADGRPAIPELTWGLHGYIFYWILSGLIAFLGLCFAQCVFCCYK